MLISGLIILKINLQFGKFYIRSLNCQVLLNRTEISPNIRSKYFLKYSGYILDIFGRELSRIGRHSFQQNLISL